MNAKTTKGSFQIECKHMKEECQMQTRQKTETNILQASNIEEGEGP